MVPSTLWESEKSGKGMSLECSAIMIAGPNTLQNELIASFLEKQISVKCVALEQSAASDLPDSDGKDSYLLLYDCMGKEVKDCMEECVPLFRKNRHMRFLCFLNVRKGSSIERNLLIQGVRGFFYLGEPFQQLVKGIRSVLSGEIWVSRKIMTDLIEKNNRGTKEIPQKILSRREAEILGMVVEGATNEEIAAKLCVSKHTVKTHLYNIFKKIDVGSRFQAALWAAKHL
jgi:DNA-binding NarL/FixJ family response regulator